MKVGDKKRKDRGKLKLGEQNKWKLDKNKVIKGAWEVNFVVSRKGKNVHFRRGRDRYTVVPGLLYGHLRCSECRWTDRPPKPTTVCSALAYLLLSGNRWPSVQKNTKMAAPKKKMASPTFWTILLVAPPFVSPRTIRLDSFRLQTEFFNMSK